MRRLFAGMAAALLAAVLFFPEDVAAISAKSAIVLDSTTGRVLFEKQPDQQMLIASTTKIMTALIVCEQCNVLDRVRVPREAVGIEGSSMYLREGEVLTVQELLYGLMLHSGNDAAVALAVYCAGTVEGFAQLMNDKAHQLGMDSTHFINPNGLDAPGHFSTARDMAVLAAYAMDNPIFAQTVATKTVTVAGRTLRNHNKLLWQIEGADGVKTGYTKAAGRILISSATRQGRRLIAVTMSDPNDWQDHKQLLEQGFENFTACKVIEAGQCLGTVELAGAQASHVNLIAAEDFSYAVTENETIITVLPGPGFVYAPVTEGQCAGYVNIMLDNKMIGKVALVYGQTVEREADPKVPFWKRLLGGGEQ